MNLILQQAYTSTLGAHIKNMYTKIGELQGQVQQHCMYPHTHENNHPDAVQLLAPEFDPDIDSKNLSIPTPDTQSHNNQGNSNTVDANECEAETTQTQNPQFKTDWPEAPTIQIP